MGRITKPLTDKEIKQAKTSSGMITLYDGGGLEYRIYNSGKKVAYFNYKHPVTNKRKNMKIGDYPIIPLAEARKIKDEYRGLIQRGICPREYKEEILDKQREASSNTLEKVARDFWKTRDQIKPETLLDIQRSLENHIFPSLGSKPITKLTAQDVKKVLMPLVARGNLETVKRLCQRLNAIMDYAFNNGSIEQNPLVKIREMFPSPKVTNIPSIEPEELPNFLRELMLSTCKPMTKLLIEWQLHTMTRPNESAGARWDEISFEKRLWTIPSDRMKRNNEQLIPLSTAAMAILERLKPMSAHREFLFPGDRNPKASCNSQTANAAIKKIATYKGRLCAHGLRSIASTYLNENNWPGDVVEAALSHVDKDEVRRAYNRGKYLKQRTEMMEAWSQFIFECAQGSTSYAGQHKGGSNG